MRTGRYWSRILALALAAITLSATTFAQDPQSDTRPQRPRGGPGPGPGRPFPPDPNFIFVGSEMRFGGKTVKGAPYSATATTESVQTLKDDNRITRTTTALVYRDSEGRTRTEQTFGAVGPFAGKEPRQVTFIQDPVA